MLNGLLSNTCLQEKLQPTPSVDETTSDYTQVSIFCASYFKGSEQSSCKRMMYVSQKLVHRRLTRKRPRLSLLATALLPCCCPLVPDAGCAVTVCRYSWPRSCTLQKRQWLTNLPTLLEYVLLLLLFWAMARDNLEPETNYDLCCALFVEISVEFSTKQFWNTSTSRILCEASVLLKSLCCPLN